MDCKLIETLVIEAKNGNMDAKEKIANEFKPFILNFSSKTFIDGYERQDIQNECYSILLKAIKLYDTSRHRFVAYATNAIKNSIYYLIRCSKTKEVTNGSSALTFTGELESLNICNNDVVEDNLLSLCDSEELNDAFSNLSPSEKDIINFIVIGNKSTRQFADARSISYSGALRNKRSALKKMGANLKNKGSYLN